MKVIDVQKKEMERGLYLVYMRQGRKKLNLRLVWEELRKTLRTSALSTKLICLLMTNSALFVLCTVLKLNKKLFYIKKVSLEVYGENKMHTLPNIESTLCLFVCTS